jgi:uncharacterized protein YdcH (DUF465 family)
MKEIDKKYDEKLRDLSEKEEKKLSALEGEYEGEIKSISYVTQKIDILTSGFKKKAHTLQEKEKEVFETYREQPNFKEDKIEARSSILSSYTEGITKMRKEKKEIKDQITCNLQTPSEMISSMNNDVPSADIED